MIPTELFYWFSAHMMQIVRLQVILMSSIQMNIFKISKKKNDGNESRFVWPSILHITHNASDDAPVTEIEAEWLQTPSNKVLIC